MICRYLIDNIVIKSNPTQSMPPPNFPPFAPKFQSSIPSDPHFLSLYPTPQQQIYPTTYQFSRQPYSSLPIPAYSSPKPPNSTPSSSLTTMFLKHLCS